MEEREAYDLAQFIAKVERVLTGSQETTAKPVLLLLSGLPGTGKSFLARRLAEALPFVIIESDVVRKILFPQPLYTAQESRWVHRTCHALMAKLLKRGVRVIYDATNLIEYHREIVYRIAQKAGARLVVVKTVASEEVVRERLRARQEEARELSDADWRVYRRMASRQEQVSHPHLVIDTSEDLEEAVAKVLRFIRR
ncbi:MAG: ATP-binding protein [Anaerolineae bacterium]|nr:ATP-binding protein [Anaerolineae bacterium]